MYDGVCVCACVCVHFLCLCVCVVYMGVLFEYSHVSDLVGHGEGGAESVVLDDGARGFRIAHGTQFRQTECVASLQLRVTADVLPDNAKVRSALVRSCLHYFYSNGLKKLRNQV